MKKTLEQIIILQDIDLLIREVSDQRTADELRKIGFALDEAGRLKQARDEIAAKVAEMDRSALSAYDRLMRRYPRAVAPVRNGICLACFIKQPTQYSAADMESVHYCEQCKRILYLI
jgi:predicted  nucleic acid-binding Zn-ribbon protein